MTINMHKESTTCIFLIVKYWTPVDTFGAETELFRSNYVTNIAADAQTPCIDRSATMVLSFYGRQVLIVLKEGFSLYLLSKKYRNWYKCKYRFMFLKMKLSRPGLKNHSMKYQRYEPMNWTLCVFFVLANFIPHCHICTNLYIKSYRLYTNWTKLISVEDHSGFTELSIIHINGTCSPENKSYALINSAIWHTKAIGTYASCHISAHWQH